jgi:hypothetical protein
MPSWKEQCTQQQKIAKSKNKNTEDMMRKGTGKIGKHRKRYEKKRQRRL